MKASNIAAFALIATFAVSNADAQMPMGHHHKSHHSIRKEHKKWKKAQKLKEKAKKHHHYK